MKRLYRNADMHLTRAMAKYGVSILRISLGVIFLWFGALKFFAELSPAEDLASRTIGRLTFGLVGPQVAIPILATWESLIGIGLITNKHMRATLALLLLQMLGTMTPLLFFPQETFVIFPIAPTLEGQYIIKNLVLISAAIVIGATVRGGDLVADPDLADTAHERYEELLENERR